MEDENARETECEKNEKQAKITLTDNVREIAVHFPVGEG